MDKNAERKKELFLRNVDKTVDCWIWTGREIGKGYGYFFLRRGFIRAHRASWELHNGPIPKGMLVCHKCDVRKCVNPDHLFLGTNTDNMRDAMRKGRVFRPIGSLNGKSKLVESDVWKIIKEKKEGLRIKAISLKLNISARIISTILNGRTWTHLTNGFLPQ